MATRSTIVVGLGAHGSSAAYHLARRGHRVLGFDKFAPPHVYGSSHGPSRIFRIAYKEGAVYVPILERAYDAWKELESEAGESLFVETGGLYMGAPDGRAISGILRSAAERNLPIEPMTAAQVRERYPSFHIPADWSAVLERRSGVLFPERAVDANLRLAAGHGAALHFNEEVIHWSAGQGTVTVKTAKGEFTADRLIISAGARLPRLLQGLDLPLAIERQAMFLVEPVANADRFTPENCPNASFEYDGRYPVYLQADFGTGVKIAIDHNGSEIDPDTADYRTTPADETKIRELIRHFVPDLDGRVLASAICLYTNTPDLDFIIDRHPIHPNVILASACSGHGFKFTSVMGEILADMVADCEPQFDLSRFSATRF